MNRSKKRQPRVSSSRRSFLQLATAAAAASSAGLTGACGARSDRSNHPKASPIYGVSSEYGPLRQVLVHAPSPSVGTLATPEQLVRYNFDANLDHRQALKEHAAFVEILRRQGTEVIEVSDVLSGDQEALRAVENDPNFMFTRDIATMLPQGAVLSRMGLPSRQPEVEIMEKVLKRLGVPIAGRLKSPATLEGGSVMCGLIRSRW